MKQRALVLALITSGLGLPGLVHAAENCAQMFVYSVTQFCRLLPTGQPQCQPVGMVGPAPSCRKPGLESLTPVPLSPPVVQAPSSGPYPFAFNPYLHPGYPGYSPPPMPTLPVRPWPVPTSTPTTGPAPAAAPQVPAVVAGPVSPAPAGQAAPAPVVPSTSAIPSSAPVPTATAPAQTSHPAPALAKTKATAATPPETADALTHFAFDSAALTPAGRAVLDAWLAHAPKDKDVRITGHADRLGPVPYNMNLSLRRAVSVMLYLTKKGLATNHVELFARGEADPVKSCPGGPTPATKKCLAPNRRVEVDPK